jgi:hypothetical protein
MPANPQSNLHPPSERDLEIYRLVRIRNQYQWEVAHDKGLHRTRVSQIVRRVDRWLAAGGSPIDPKFKNDLQQRRLTRALQKLRLLRALEIATDQLEFPAEPTVKTRTRFQGATEISREVTKVEVPYPRLFALQNYIAAVKALQAFERDVENDAPPDEIAPADALPPLVQLLCRFRLEAEADGQVQSSHDAFHLVVTTLRQLLGPRALQDHLTANPPDSAAAPALTGSTGTSAHLAHQVSATPEITAVTNSS